MTAVHGKSSECLVDSLVISDYMNEITPDRSCETAETTTFANDDKTYIPGLRDGTISLSGFYDAIADNNMNGRLADAGHEITVFPEGRSTNRTSDNGQRTLMMETIENAYAIPASVGDAVGLSAEYMVNDYGMVGGVNLANETVSTNSTNFDSAGVDEKGSAGTTAQGGVMVLHVLTNGRATSTTVKIQDSADNISFADTSPATEQSVGAGVTGGWSVECTDTTLRRYVRSRCTTSTGGGDFEYCVSFGRRRPNT